MMCEDCGYSCDDVDTYPVIGSDSADVTLCYECYMNHVQEGDVEYEN
jgi:hypothetical protein